MLNNTLSGTLAVVTGASRGFGAGIAEALVAAGVKVVGVARDEKRLDVVSDRLGGEFIPVVGDVAKDELAVDVISKFQPQTIVLNAGAMPPVGTIQEHDWQTFSRNWDVDVQQVFHWTRESLLAPLAPGGTVISVSSGAALAGSPLSGGYAGAKAAIKFIASYAARESDRGCLGIRFVSLLPRLTPATELGERYVSAYANDEGISLDDFLARMGPALTPAQVGKAVVELASGPDPTYAGALLTAAGLTPLT